MNAERPFLTPKELASRWRLSEQTLANWRHGRKGPPFVRIGAKVLYPSEAVQAFEKLSPQWLGTDQPTQQQVT
jgi:hypothetical protein